MTSSIILFIHRDLSRPVSSYEGYFSLLTRRVNVWNGSLEQELSSLYDPTASCLDKPYRVVD